MKTKAYQEYLNKGREFIENQVHSFDEKYSWADEEEIDIVAAAVSVLVEERDKIEYDDNMSDLFKEFDLEIVNETNDFIETLWVESDDCINEIQKITDMGYYIVMISAGRLWLRKRPIKLHAALPNDKI